MVATLLMMAVPKLLAVVTAKLPTAVPKLLAVVMALLIMAGEQAEASRGSWRVERNRSIV